MTWCNEHLLRGTHPGFLDWFSKKIIHDGTLNGKITMDITWLEAAYIKGYNDALKNKEAAPHNGCGSAQS